MKDAAQYEVETLARMMSDVSRDQNHQMAELSAGLEEMTNRLNFLENRVVDYEQGVFLAIMPTPYSC